MPAIWTEDWSAGSGRFCPWPKPLKNRKCMAIRVAIVSTPEWCTGRIVFQNPNNAVKLGKTEKNLALRLFNHCIA